MPGTTDIPPDGCVSEILVHRDVHDDVNCFLGLRYCDDDHGFRCRTCGCDDATRLSTRQTVLKCVMCNANNGVTAGTIFHGSKLDLRQVLLAMALYWDTAGGARGRDYRNLLGVTWKTAYMIRQRLINAKGSPFDGRVATWREYAAFVTRRRLSPQAAEL